MVYSRKILAAKGFSLAELILTIAILTVSTGAVIQLLGKMETTVRARDVFPQISFYEQIFEHRIEMLLGNLLYWIINTSNGCNNAGAYFYSRDPKNSNSPCNICLQGEFLHPRYIGPRPGANFEIFLNLFDGYNVIWPTYSEPNSVIDQWYTTYRNSSLAAQNPQIFDMIEKCRTSSIRLIPPGASGPGINSLLNRSEFTFCLAFAGKKRPDNLTRFLNSTAVRSDRFQIAFVHAILWDGKNNTRFTCQNSGILGNIFDRSINASMEVGIVYNTTSPPAEQIVQYSKKAFFSKKLARKVLNCNNTDDSGNLAWRYECRPTQCANQCKGLP